MSTDIKTGNLLVNLAKQAGTPVNGKKAEGSAPRKEGPPATDSVSMTDQASRLQAMEEKLAAMPDVNHARVDALKRAIADGSYEVNPQRVADKLLAFPGPKDGGK